VLGAAAAKAAARAELSPPPAELEPRPATPPPAGEAELPAEPDPVAPEQREVALPDPVDVTDELPRIHGGSPLPGRRDPEDRDRDDLRTTAQLAILIDDLQSRRDGS
jgi:hypothetical protein